MILKLLAWTSVAINMYCDRAALEKEVFGYPRTAVKKALKYLKMEC